MSPRSVIPRSRRVEKMVKVRRIVFFFSCICVCALAKGATTQKLPAAYFRLMQAGATQVEQQMDAGPEVSLASLETRPGWKHFPYSILAPAVLYTKRHPDNPRYHDPKMLALALRIGDLLAAE